MGWTWRRHTWTLTINEGSLNGGGLTVDSVAVVGPQLSTDAAAFTSATVSTTVIWWNRKAAALQTSNAHILRYFSCIQSEVGWWPDRWMGVIVIVSCLFLHLLHFSTLIIYGAFLVLYVNVSVSLYLIVALCLSSWWGLVSTMTRSNSFYWLLHFCVSVNTSH